MGRRGDATIMAEARSEMAPNASKIAQNLCQSRGSLHASYVWESLWDNLRMSLHHSYPIVTSLGPSSAYLGPFLQPTCYSTSLFGHLDAQTNSSQPLFGKLCRTLSLPKTIDCSMVFASFANRLLCSLSLAS